MFAQSLPLILTLFAIGAGIFFNNKGLSDLRADMKDMKSELKADIAGSEGRLEARMDRLEARLIGVEGRLDGRLNAIESELIRSSELKGHLEGRIDEIVRIAKLTSERVAA